MLAIVAKTCYTNKVFLVPNGRKEAKMICNNCGKELPEGSVLCCFCAASVEEVPAEPVTEEIAAEVMEETIEAAEEAAEETAEEEIADEAVTLEETPKKSSKWWIAVLAAVAGVALLAVLAGAILFGLGLNPFAKNELTAKENYTVGDDKARDSRDVVVATIGNEELTSGELQIYYWETVMNFVNSNYYYLSAYGLDITQPLNEQACAMAEGQTWQQFFLEAALSTWQRYTTLQLMAHESGYEMEEEMKTFLEGLPASMQTNATNYGYDTVIAWLEDNCGPGVSEAGYIEYVNAYYEGTFFLTDHYDELKPNDADVEAYFTENEQLFTEQGVTKDSGKYYDVRHILIAIEGGTEDAEGHVTYSDADWEACRKKAQDLLDQWTEEDGTEGGFGNFAMLYSADGGSSTNGGLYDNLTADTNFVQEFKDWYMDESRAVGDTGLVKTIHGYHIMYFSGSSQIWFDTATEELMADRVSDYIDEGIAKYPMKVNYRKILLGDHEIA